MFSEFDNNQIDKLIELLKDILSRHDEIKPTYVIGHSDISPDRKFDPGPKFPWKRLYENGIGAWYDEETFLENKKKFRKKMPSISQIQCGLKKYGYDLELTNEMDEQTFYVIRAFQYHFTPKYSDGNISIETVSALWALLEKYFPEGSDVPPSKASSDIWNDPDGFKKAIKNFELASLELSMKSQNKNMDQTIASFRNLAGTCKGCHQKYKN